MAANTRQEPGHWETDLIVGRGRAALQTTVERTSRYVRLKRVDDKSAAATRQALISVLATFPQILRRSVTYDNGSENTEHIQVNQILQTRSYFCAPHHS